MESDHAFHSIIPSQLGLERAGHGAQEASGPNPPANVCPLCFCEPLDETGSTGDWFRRPTATESFNSRQQTPPRACQDVDLNEPSGSTSNGKKSERFEATDGNSVLASESSSQPHVGTESVEACKNATQKSIRAILNHIADHLEFLALLTPRLWTEKLADGELQVFSSSRAVSSEGISGKRSTLDDESGGGEEANLGVLEENIPHDVESTGPSPNIIPDSASDCWRDVPGYELLEEDKFLEEVMLSGAFQSHAVKANDKPFPIDVCSDLPPPFPYPHLLMRDKNKERGGVKLPAAAY